MVASAPSIFLRTTDRCLFFVGVDIHVPRYKRAACECVGEWGWGLHIH